MSALNVKDYLVSNLRSQHSRLANDLKALPSEALNKSFAGCARTPLHIIAECAWLNNWIAELLETGKADRLSDEEEEALFSSVDTVDTAISMLDASVERLVSAYQDLDENTLGDITDKPFGRPAPRYNGVSLPISHMMYHDGQLNYLQSLYGDDKIHW